MPYYQIKYSKNIVDNDIFNYMYKVSFSLCIDTRI